MFVIGNKSYGDPAHMIKNAYIILLVHFIDIELCIFNHSYVHPSEDGAYNTSKHKLFIWPLYVQY